MTKTSSSTGKPPVCEADERNRRALFEIGRQRTEDAISLRRIEHILTGDACDHEAGNKET